MNRACVTGGAGFIGSHVADRLRADGVEVTIVDDFRTGRREFVEHLLSDPGVTLHEGDVLDQALLERAMRGLRLGVSPSGQRRRAPRPRAPAQGPRAEHDRHRQRARGDAGRRRVEDRVLLDRLGLRRAGGVPHARGRAVPAPDLAVRRLEAGRRGHDRRVRPRLRVHRPGVQVRLDPGRALHPRPRVRLLLRAQARPAPAARPRRRPAGEVLPVRQGLRRGDHDRGARARRAAGRARASTTWAPTRPSWSTTRSA